MPSSRSKQTRPFAALKLLSFFALGTGIGYAAFTAFPPAKPVQKASIEQVRQTLPNSEPEKKGPQTASQPSASTPLLASLAQIAPQETTRARAALLPTYLSLMVGELSQQNPEKAAALIEAQFAAPSNDVTLNLLKTWSQTDPAAALSWLRENQQNLEPLDRPLLVESVLIQYAKQDPEFAAAQLHSLPPQQKSRELINAIATSLAASNPDQAMAWLKNLRSDQFTSSAVEHAQVEILKHSLQADPQSAAAMIDEISSNELLLEIVPHTAVAWAQRDLAEAVSWLEGQSNQQVQQASLAAIANHSVQNDPQAAFDLLMSFPDWFDGSDATGPLANALTRIATQDPALILAEFETIPEIAKAKVAADLTATWMDNGYPDSELRDWVTALGNRETKNLATRVAYERLASSDPLLAVEWAQNLSDTSETVELVSALLDQAPLEDLPDLLGRVSAIGMSGSEYAQLQKRLESRLNRSLPTLPMPTQ